MAWDPDQSTTDARRPEIGESPGALIGPFKLLQQIGEGGFGVVFMAEQERPIRRRVALKIIKLGMDTRQVIARFEAERQALAMMDHPNIAKVLDAGATESGRPYFVMELVRGVPITEYCDTNTLDTRARLELFIPVCRAVQHAHQKGIIHRDIKPSNVLVTMHDGVPIPKVIDFGIAKATQTRLTDKTLFTEFRQFVGTPQYMSPEQAEMSALDVDTRSDIYSLGVLLYELLTGTTPFDPEKLRSAAYGEMQRIIREVEPPRPSTRVSTLIGDSLSKIASHRRTDPAKLGRLMRGELDWIVMRCLEKDRTRRYDTASDVAADIQRHLSNEPVVAAPPSLRYRASKFVRKNRGPVVAATALAFVLLVGIIGTAWGLKQATKANVVLDQQRQEVQQQRDAAVAANQRADAEALRGNRELSESRVVRGIDALEKSDPALAILWFAQALKLDAGNPHRERIQRIRIANTLERIPRLLNIPAPTTQSRTIHGSYVLHPYTGEKSTVEVLDINTRKRVFPSFEIADALAEWRFAPDGQSILTKTKRDELRLWSTETGKPLIAPIAHTWGNYFFSSDGKLLAVSTSTNVRLFDAHTGNPIGEPITQEQTYDIAFSPDNRSFATAAHDGTVRIWEAATCKPIARVQHPSRVNHVLFSPDGTRLVTQTWGLKDGPHYAQLWSAQTGLPLSEPIDLNDAVSQMLFSPDGKTLAIRMERSLMLVALADNAPPVKTWIDPESGFTRAAVFSPDGKAIALCHEGDSLRIWETATGKPITPWIKHSGNVQGMAFNSDGSLLATASDDGTVRVWYADSGSPVSPVLRHGSPVFRVRFSHDDSTLTTYLDGWPPRVWTLRTFDTATRFKEASSDRCMSAIYAPGGASLITVGEDGASLWDTATVRRLVPPLLREVPTRQHGYSLYYWTRSSTEVRGHDAVFSPSGRLLATQHEEELQFWDTRTGMRVGALIDKGDTRGAFNPSESIFATWDDDGVHFWSVVTGTAVGKAIPFDKASHAVFSHDGQRIAVTSDAASAQVFDASTGAGLSPPIPHPDMVTWAAFSPDDKILVTYCQDGSPRAFDARSGQPISWTPQYGAWLGPRFFSADGKVRVRRLTMGIQLWDAIADEPITPILRGDDAILSPDASLLATCTRRFQSYQVWHARTGTAITPSLERRYLAPVLFNHDSSAVLTVTQNGKIISLQPSELPFGDLQQLAELLAASRIDTGGAVVPLTGDEWQERWSKLRSAHPELFKVPEKSSTDSQIAQGYRDAVAAHVVAATTVEARKALSVHFSHGSDVERNSDRIQEAILLAETAVHLDESNIDAFDNLGVSYITDRQYEKAKAIYEKYRGRRYNNEYYAANEKDIALGQHTRFLIGTLREQGHDSPILKEIEALLPPKPSSTQPATSQPAP